MKGKWALVAATLIILMSVILAFPSISNAQEGFTGGIYSQNFDSLANTAGSTTNIDLPTGWALTETGGGTRDNEQYAVDIGSSNTGDTYSYGASGSTERAFGGLQSGALIPVIGVQFQNKTGRTIGTLSIAYVCEQWRLGTADRTDRMDFQYSTNATSLSDGTWIDVDTLDCLSTTTATPTGAKDGNTVRTAISGNVTDLTIPNDAIFWLRWMDFNASGADDGLAIDDFTMSALTPTAISLRTLTATGASGSTALPALGLLAFGGVALYRRRRG